MRCQCCDRVLTDFEATRKHAVTGMFIDLCQQCFKTVQMDANLPTKDRRDLISEDDIDDSVEGEDEHECNIGDTLDGKDY